MRLNIFLKLFLPIIAVFIIFGMAIFLTIFHDIEKDKVEMEKTMMADFVLAQARSHLAAEDFSDPIYQKTGKFELFLNEVKTKETVNIKIWSARGEILYSDIKEEEGKFFPGNEEFREAMAGGKAVAEIKNKADLVKKYASSEEGASYGRLMEVYIPIDLSGSGIANGVIESYLNLDYIDKEINGIKRGLGVIVFGGLVALLIIVFLLLNILVISPIGVISAAIGKIKSGDFRRRIGIKTNDETGDLAKVFNEMMDDIQNSDKKIKEEHKELKAIISSMGEGLIVLDRNLDIVLLNRTAESFLNVSLKDVAGKNIKKVLTLLKGNKELPPEEWPARRMLKSGKSVTVTTKDDIYYKTVYGRTFPVEITTAPFLRNGIIGAIVVFKDVSKMKSIEEDNEFARINLENALRSVYIERDIAEEQKNKLEAILNSIGDAVFAIDRERKIIIFNPIAEMITGFRLNRVLGTRYDSHLKFLDEISRIGKTEYIEKALLGENVSVGNHVVLETKDKSLISVEGSVTPIKNQKGEIMGCIVVFRDITAKRKLEAMRSDFISIASHQLRTPLSATKWFLEILVNGDVGTLKKKQLEILREAYVNNQSMINLVNTMLSMSRIESKQLVINLEKVNLEIAVRKILADLKPLLDKKDQKLKFYGLRDKKLEIETDKVLLRNVIDNLVINASKYSPGGAEIVARAVMKSAGWLMFSVSDRGIGIPKNEHYKIFKKFSRTNNAVAYNASGTGLGLYIVKSILDVFGGKIWF